MGFKYKIFIRRSELLTNYYQTPILYGYITEEELIAGKKNKNVLFCRITRTRELFTRMVYHPELPCDDIPLFHQKGFNLFMGLFYNATAKELLEIRKKIFLDKGMPMLQKNGFEKSPFSSSWFGKDDTGGYTYEFYRLTKDSFLQQVSVGILKGDRYIQIHLNIFKLNSQITSLQQLNNVDGMQFCLPPNSLSNMRLHVDDFRGIPLFNYDFMFRSHKLAIYFTKRGCKKAAEKLAERIENDLADFNKYVIRCVSFP